MNTPVSTRAPGASALPRGEPHEVFYFTELLKRPVCLQAEDEHAGRLSDIVFRIAEPYPEAVGICAESGWLKPPTFIPWDRVIKIERAKITVAARQDGQPFAPFRDQRGWLLLNEHFMGRWILDMHGRRTEVVNDVHLLHAQDRMLLVHVDISINGFLRRLGLKKLARFKEGLVPWRYVQPLSLEDMGKPDTVALSLTHKQIHELPKEDLADVLETLSGREREGLFSTLPPQKAAEVLAETQPGTQRQLVASLHEERKRRILSEMSAPRIAALCSILPQDSVSDLMKSLPSAVAANVKAILASDEPKASSLMSSDYLPVNEEALVGDVLREIKTSKFTRDSLSYLYVLRASARHFGAANSRARAAPGSALIGVVDLRKLLLSSDIRKMADIMDYPVISAGPDDTREEVAALFARYNFRMIPVLDKDKRLLGVIKRKDVLGPQPIRRVR